MTERFRLWRTRVSNSAYEDQHGWRHPAAIVFDEVDVEVVERRSAIGMWGRQPAEGMAVRALAADGREFTCNWHGTYADDSPTPLWSWLGPNGLCWEMAMMPMAYPSLYPDGRRAIYVAGGEGIGNAYAK